MGTTIFNFFADVRPRPFTYRRRSPQTVAPAEDEEPTTPPPPPYSPYVISSLAASVVSPVASAPTITGADVENECTDSEWEKEHQQKSVIIERF